MRLEVTDVGGCRSADIPLKRGKVTLLTGLNGSGKTSVARALQACLTGNGNPLKLPASQWGAYAWMGRTKGSRARLTVGDKTLEWKPPGQADTGGLPEVDPFVVDPGDLLLTGASAKDFWTRMLAPEVTEEAVRQALDEALAGGVSEGPAEGQRRAIVDDFLTYIGDPSESKGWLVALGSATALAREAKANWREDVARTGETLNWGSRKGGLWRPKHWPAECEGLNITSAAKVLDAAKQVRAKAREKLDELRVAERMTRKFRVELDEIEAEIPKLETIVENEESKREQQEQLRAQYLAEVENLRVWEAERDRLNKLGKEASAAAKGTADETAHGSCPHCGLGVCVENWVPDLYGQTSAVSLRVPRSGQEASEAAQRRWQKLRKDFQRHLEGNPGNPEWHAKVPGPGESAAAKRLAKLRVNQVTTRNLVESSTVDCSPERAERLMADVNHAEERERVAELNQQSVMALHRAQGHHKAALMWLKVVKVLKPEGLRGRIMAGKVERFNKAATRLASMAGWPQVTLDPKSLALKLDSSGGIDLRLGSGSERFIATVTVAAVLAWLGKLPVFCIDGAEILVGLEAPGDSLQGLFRVCQTLAKVTGMACLVTLAACNRPQDDAAARFPISCDLYGHMQSGRMAAQ